MASIERRKVPTFMYGTRGRVTNEEDSSFNRTDQFFLRTLKRELLRKKKAEQLLKESSEGSRADTSQSLQAKAVPTSVL